MIALALAIPFLFLHIKYQPGVRVPLGSTHLGLELSDAAVVVVAIAAFVEGVRRGFGSLRPALALGIGLSALIFAGRRVGWIPVVAGSLGLILAGASAGVVGVGLGAVAL